MRNRFLAFVLVLIMCLASVQVTVLADDFVAEGTSDHGFVSEISLYTGGKCDIHILLYSTLTGEPLSQAELEGLQPYAVIRRMDESEYMREYFSSYEMMLSVPEPGNYLFSICIYEDNLEIKEAMISITEDFFDLQSSEYTYSAEEIKSMCKEMIFSVHNLEFEGFSAEESMKMSAREVRGFLESLGFYNEEFLAALRTELSTVENGKYLPFLSLVEQSAADIQENPNYDETFVVPMFTDVSEDEWYFIYIAIASDSGLLKGKSDGIFAPNDNMTVAEAITLASRMNVFLHDNNPQDYFESGSPWYQPYVDYARESGLPWQYSDYNTKITRKEFAHIFNSIHEINNNILKETFGIIEINAVSDGAVPDVPINSEYAADIYKLYRLGIIGGSNSAREFFPDSNIKRSEVAAIICRLLGFEIQEFTL